MIGVESRGRMGNQMFEYAFALSTSTARETAFFIADGDIEFGLQRYFELAGFHRRVDKLRRLWSRSALCSWRHNRVIDDADDDPIARKRRYRFDRTIYSGFFQAECFFEDVKPAVRRSFAIKKALKIAPRALLRLPPDTPYVAVHVRLTDYVGGFKGSPLGAGDLTLPARYYKDALAQVPNVADHAVVIVSDDVVKARDMVGDGLNYHFCSFDPITDFQILLGADVLIASPSSFSWWAAYLGDVRQVFAPQHWLGFKLGREYPRGIIQSAWVQVAV